jgi:hypothetical protein
MLPDATVPVPASVMALLSSLAPLFTAPSFRTFCGLACGFLAQTGKRTVCGMLTGAGLFQRWSHDRAHYCLARARWDWPGPATGEDPNFPYVTTDTVSLAFRQPGKTPTGPRQHHRCPSRSMTRHR